MIYTVIGYYESDGQTFADHINAANTFDAISLVSASASRLATDLVIVGAIEGEHELVAACEDSGKIAFAIDLR